MDTESVRRAQGGDHEAFADPVYVRRIGSRSAVLVALAVAVSCTGGGASAPPSLSCNAGASSAPAAATADEFEGGSVVIVGRIVTMDDPPIAEALLIEAGRVACVGSRDEVLARAGREMPVVDIGQNVAYGRGRVNPKTPEWVLDQLLTAEQGLRAVTLDAAYALGDEDRRGHLAPGTLGDITILSGDVLDASPDDIRAMEVIATIVDGIVVHCSDTEVCG